MKTSSQNSTTALSKEETGSTLMNLGQHWFRLFRVSSGQGKVREIPDLAKVREKSGNFVESQGKNEYWEKSGNLHLVQSK